MHGFVVLVGLKIGLPLISYRQRQALALGYPFRCQKSGRDGQAPNGAYLSRKGLFSS
jgi:hypothetical protein